MPSVNDAELETLYADTGKRPRVRLSQPSASGAVR